PHGCRARHGVHDRAGAVRPGRRRLPPLGHGRGHRGRDRDPHRLSARHREPDDRAVVSYWVVPGAFRAGPYPESADEFDTYVDLTEDGELPAYEAADHRRFPIPDFGKPTREQMDAIL